MNKQVHMNKPKFDPNQPHDIVEDSVQSTPEVAPTSSNDVNDIESVARGVASSIPLNNQIAGVAKALFDNSGGSFGERYNKNNEIWRAEQAKAKAEDPALFTTGEIAGDIGLFTVLPGESVVANIAKMFGTSFVKGVGDHPEGSLGKQVMDSSVDAAVGHTAGVVLGKGMKIAGNVAKNSAINTTIEWLTDGTKSLKSTLNDHVFKYYNSGEKAALSAIEAHGNFIDDVGKITVQGQPLLHAKSTQESLAKGIKLAKSEVGTKIGNTLKNVESEIDVSSLETKLKNLIPMSDDAETQAFNKALSDNIDRSLYEFTPEKIKNADGSEVIQMIKGTPKKFSAERLHNLRSDIAAKINWNDTTATLKNRALVSQNMAIGDTIANAVESSGADELMTPFKELNKQYTNLSVLEDITHSKGPVGVGGGIISSMKKAATLSGTGIGAMAMYGGMNPVAAVSVGLATRQLLASGEAFSPKLASSLQKVSKQLIEGPSSKLSQSVMAAAAGTTEKFHDAVLHAGSTLSLKEAPLERNSADLKNKSDDVLQILNRIDPKSANALRDAINNGDEATQSQIMEQVAKHPDSKGLIKPGVGWNGTVSDPNDKAMLHGQIDSMDISLKQKLQHKKALDLNGTVPQVKQELPYYIEYKARNKKITDY
jgi:flagellar motility protein MotE (MotC chaperone)